MGVAADRFFLLFLGCLPMTACLTVVNPTFDAGIVKGTSFPLKRLDFMAHALAQGQGCFQVL
jgi:hypothetical protein